MNFPDYIATEHADEFGDITRWHVEVTPAPAQLVVRSWGLENGREKYPWSYSVRLIELDADSVTIQEAHTETDLHHLHVCCRFYRGAIVTTREYDPAFLHRSVVLRLPLAKEIPDPAAAAENFKAFLKTHAAPIIAPPLGTAKEWLKPIEVALQPAQGVQVSSNDQKSTLEYTVTLDAENFSLVCRMQRTDAQKKSLLGIFRKTRAPEVETDTFELLSTDVTLNDCSRIAPDETVFMAKLYAVEHLDTREHSSSAYPGTYRMWYVDVLFPDEAAAKKFLDACATVIPQIRERLAAFSALS